MIMTTKPSVNKKRVLIIAAAAIVLIAAIVAGTLCFIFKPGTFDNVEREYVYIYPQSSCNDVVAQLKPLCSGQLRAFKFLYHYFKLDENIPAGAYTVVPGQSEVDFLKNVYRRQQTPVKFTFNNTRTIEAVALRAGEQLLMSADSLSRLLLNEQTPGGFGFTSATFPAMFIPNTYELYWNISAPAFLTRMKKEYDLFWNQQRKEKAERAGLTPLEVCILASIVEEESNLHEEQPIIAGLYLNRLRRGMLLQADPTVKFAVGDFTLRRILNEHLKTESPYNTYLYAGLPPGPIRIPSSQAINAVLNAANHNYLYMCAKEDFSGRHNFAVSLSEHNRNAARYHSALNLRRIR